MTEASPTERPAGDDPVVDGVPGPGDRLGPYRLLERLGSGASGVVYLADGPQGPVAVKVLRAELLDRPGTRQRLNREANLVRRAAGAGIVRLLDVDTTVAHPYLVMEHVGAPDLGRLVDTEGPLTGERLDRFASSLVAAISHIHRSGIVHRDLKPANVLVGTDGTAHLTDFGIALAVEHTGAVDESRGTTGWLAPEVRAGGSATAASDVYGWGRLVTYAATGDVDAPVQDVPDGWRAAVVAATAAAPSERAGAYVPAAFTRQHPVVATEAGSRRRRPLARLVGRAPAAFTEPPGAADRPSAPGRWRRRRIVLVAVVGASIGLASVAALVSSRAPVGATSIVVYDESFAPGFSLNPWNGTNDARSTGVVRSGELALTTLPAPNQGFYVAVDDGVALSGYATLRFWVNGGEDGIDTMRVVAHRDVASEVGSAQPMGRIPAHEWRRVDVAVRDLLGDARAYDGFHARLLGFVNGPDAPARPVVFDRIELLAR